MTGLSRPALSVKDRHLQSNATRLLAGIVPQQQLVVVVNVAMM